MSWVSQANLKTIMTAIRNKFTTGDLVIANDAKNTGVELNYTAQDGLVTVSPISTDASVESALHLSNGDDTKKTELTQGTLSYVTGTGDSEAYNYMSLLGNGVTFGKKGGGNVQVGGVADPTSAQQVATKNYVDNHFKVVKITKKYTGSSEYISVGASSGVALLGERIDSSIDANKVICAYSIINKNYSQSKAVATEVSLSTSLTNAVSWGGWYYNVTAVNCGKTSSSIALNKVSDDVYELGIDTYFVLMN